MKYFLDTEFIEGFHKPLFGKRRHFIDMIGIGLVGEDGSEYSAISNEWRYKDADEWVKKNVIIPLYISNVHGDNRNRCHADNFHLTGYGKSNRAIADDLRRIFQHDKTPIEIYAYYADYDWVLFCSLFGRMTDLPVGLPMYCLDLKQIMINNGISEEWKERECPEPANAHNFLADARWNKTLFERIQAI